MQEIDLIRSSWYWFGTSLGEWSQSEKLPEIKPPLIETKKKFKSHDENPIIESTPSQYNYYPILFENACNYLQALTSKGTKY